MHTISHTNIFTPDLHVNIDSKHLLFTKYCPENIHVYYLYYILVLYSKCTCVDSKHTNIYSKLLLSTYIY